MQSICAYLFCIRTTNSDFMSQVVSSCKIPINLVFRNRGPEAERPIPEAVEGKITASHHSPCACH